MYGDNTQKRGGRIFVRLETYKELVKELKGEVIEYERRHPWEVVEISDGEARIVLIDDDGNFYKWADEEE